MKLLQAAGRVNVENGGVELVKQFMVITNKVVEEELVELLLMEVGSPFVVTSVDTICELLTVKVPGGFSTALSY